MLMKFGGVLKSWRYKLAGGSEGQPPYLAFYLFTDEAAFESYKVSPERQALLAEMKESWGTDGFQDSLPGPV